MLHLGEPEFATIQNTPAVDAFHLTPSWSERPAHDGATPTALNNRRLARELMAHVCACPAIIVDLCDAAAFIDMHGDRTQLWVTAETGVKCADRNPRLIDQATKTLENALHREGMLD